MAEVYCFFSSLLGLSSELLATCWPQKGNQIRSGRVLALRIDRLRQIPLLF